MLKFHLASASCRLAQLTKLTRSRRHSTACSPCVSASGGIGTGRSHDSMNSSGATGNFNPTTDNARAAFLVKAGGSDGSFKTETAHSRRAVVSSTVGAFVRIEIASGMKAAAVYCLVLSEFQTKTAKATTMGTRTEPTTLLSISILSQPSFVFSSTFKIPAPIISISYMY